MKVRGRVCERVSRMRRPAWGDQFVWVWEGIGMGDGGADWYYFAADAVAGQ